MESTRSGEVKSLTTPPSKRTTPKGAIIAGTSKCQDKLFTQITTLHHHCHPVCYMQPTYCRHQKPHHLESESLANEG
uniref:Uncharacterized protein n=1 Tax=Aegilops tauschii subsp. strangulata TaxID=200361 RepID=A0A453NDL2_AEGTS